jgi:hypothetical protein
MRGGAPRSRVRSDSPPAQRPTSADRSTSLRVCSSRASHAPFALAATRCNLPSCISRPPRRPGDGGSYTTVREIRSSDAATGDVRHNSTESLVRRLHRVEDRYSGSLFERTGIRSTASGPHSGQALASPLRRLLYVGPPQANRSVKPVGRRRRAHPGGCPPPAVSQRSMTSTSAPASTPSPSGSRARPLAAAMPESTFEACRPARATT